MNHNQIMWFGVIGLILSTIVLIIIQNIIFKKKYKLKTIKKITNKL